MAARERGAQQSRGNGRGGRRQAGGLNGKGAARICVCVQRALYFQKAGPPGKVKAPRLQNANQGPGAPEARGKVCGARGALARQRVLWFVCAPTLDGVVCVFNDARQRGVRKTGLRRSDGTVGKSGVVGTPSFAALRMTDAAPCRATPSPPLLAPFPFWGMPKQGGKAPSRCEPCGAVRSRALLHVRWE